MKSLHRVLFDLAFKWVLLTTFSCVFVGARGQTKLRGIPFIKHYTPQEYKAGIQNWDIAQDSRGVIYIANNYGLLEFDGQEWQTYRVSNGSKMRSIALADDGRIYVGCQGDFGFFFPSENGQLRYTSLADSLTAAYRNFDETWSVFIDNEDVYFCTFTRIYIYRNGHFKIIDSQNPLELSFHVSRQLYTLEKERGLSWLISDSLQLAPHGEFFARTSVSSILPLAKDNLLIATFQDGVYEWTEDGIAEWNAGNQKLFRESIVNAVLPLHNGHLAIGTQNSGLFITDKAGNVQEHLTTGRGLQNRTVLSLYEDDLGNLWVGQNNGISYVELGSPFSLLNEERGLPGTGYAGFLDGSMLYVGTNNGLYAMDLRSNLQTTQLVEGTRGQVYHIGKYGGELLMGHHTGAYRIEGLKATRLSEVPGAWIFALLPGTESKTLLGGTYNGFQVFNKQGGHWQFSHKLNSFQESSRVLEFSRSGELWMTHGYKGAYRMHVTNDSIRSVAFYGAQKGFPSNHLINVYKIRNELLFTSERGIFQYDASRDTFVNEPQMTELLGADAQVWVMKEDLYGNIYFIGSQAAGVLKKNATGNYEVETSAFNRIRVFLNDDLENFHLLSNNEVIFGAKEGFIHYDPTRSIQKSRNFNTLIRSVSLAEQQRDSIIYHGNTVVDAGGRSVLDAPVELQYSQNAVRFRFSATTYEGGEVQFQYYLENFEKTWTDWSSATSKEYTNLKEGRYTFFVRARNASGEISQPAHYTFYVHPPWYRSLWAILLYVLLIAGALLTSYYLMDRKYKRAQRLMRLKQKKELIRKENELERVTHQTQQEIARLQHEKLESELMHLNKELGTSTFHLLNKNEFISGIKVSVNGILKKENNQELKKELLKIVHEIEQNIATDSDWEQFQIHFDRVHGDFAQRFRQRHPNLSPQEIKLSSYLRMNLSTKEIAQLLHISVRGVEISRYRLRKKLGLEREVNLQEYILAFGTEVKS